MSVRYTDLIGFKYFPVFHQMFQATAIHSDTGTTDYKQLSTLISTAFGTFMAFLVAFQGWGSFVAGYDSLNNGDFSAVSNVMAYLSVTLSSLSKFQVARTHRKAIHRMGLWLQSVQSKRINMKKSTLEVVALTTGKSMFYFGNLCLLVWCSVPLAKDFKSFIPTKFPFMSSELSEKVSFPMIQVPCYLFLILTITYTASTLLHFLATFCTEVKILGRMWALVEYRKSQPEYYVCMMKSCVDQHVKLLEVMKDLNTIHDSMFSFQVMIFVIHICAFNFCVLKTSLSNAVTSLFPLFGPSTVELGLLCWIGEEITHGLQNFHRMVYMTNWYKAPLKEKKNLVLVLNSLKKKYQLTGATVFVASLDTYVEALRQGFSLYTLMKALTTAD